MEEGDNLDFGIDHYRMGFRKDYRRGFLRKDSHHTDFHRDFHRRGLEEVAAGV